MTGAEAHGYLSLYGHRILVMLRQHIGDVVNSTAALHSIRKEWPRAHIGVSVGVKAAGVLENSPDFDELIPRPWSRDIKSKAQYIWSLRHGAFDVTIILDEVGSQARNAKLAGAKKVFGVSLDEAPKNLDFWTQFDENGHDTRDQNSGLLRAMGVRELDDQPRLYPSESDRRAVEAMLWDLDRPYVIVHPGASERTRHWLPERIAEVIRETHRLGFEVVVTGSKAEVPLCQDIVSLSNTRCRELAGKTSILEFAVLASRAEAVITGDTGPMHVAAAMGARIVAIFGPTHPAKTGPWGVGHEILVGECGCGNRDWTTCSMACMRSISVEQVLAALSRITEKAKV